MHVSAIHHINFVTICCSACTYPLVFFLSEFSVNVLSFRCINKKKQKTTRSLKGENASYRCYFLSCRIQDDRAWKGSPSRLVEIVQVYKHKMREEYSNAEIFVILFMCTFLCSFSQLLQEPILWPCHFCAATEELVSV